VNYQFLTIALRFIVSSAVNRRGNRLRTNLIIMPRNYNSLATSLSLTVKAHVHSVTCGRGKLHKSQQTYARRAVRKAHFNRAFKIILIGVGRNPERCVVVINNNVHLISEMYEDIASKTANLSISTTPLLFGDSFPINAVWFGLV